MLSHMKTLKMCTSQKQILTLPCFSVQFHLNTVDWTCYNHKDFPVITPRMFTMCSCCTAGAARVDRVPRLTPALLSKVSFWPFTSLFVIFF